MKVQNKTFIFSGKVLLAFLLLIYLFWANILNENSLLFFRSHSVAAIILSVYTFLIFFFNAFRWWILLKVQNIDTPFLMIFRITYFSALCGFVLPGIVSGDVVRLIASRDVSKLEKNKVAFSIFFDRGIGVFGLILIGLTFFFFVQQGNTFYLYNGILYIILCLFLIIGGGFAVQFLFHKIDSYMNSMRHAESGLLLSILDGFTGSVVVYRQKKKILLFCLFLSIACHMIAISSVYIIANMLGSESGIGEIAISSSLAFLSNFIPLTPGGVGIGEGVMGKASSILASVETISVNTNSFFVFRIITIITLLPSLVFFVKKFMSRTNK